jgi:hypothetical protein
MSKTTGALAEALVAATKATHGSTDFSGPLTRDTWKAQVTIADPVLLLSRLRTAGLPLSSVTSDESATGESDSSRIVCLASIVDGNVHAVVLDPNGHAYRFEPAAFEKHFWEFAAKYYYMVTGNLEDRRRIAALTEVPFANIVGRAVIRAKVTEPSGMTLDEMLTKFGITSAKAIETTEPEAVEGVAAQLFRERG